MRLDTIVGYTYKADTYCDDCIVAAVCASMDIEGHGLSFETEGALDRLAISTGIDRMDEATFDSGDFPKVVFADQCEDDTCGACHNPLI